MGAIAKCLLILINSIFLVVGLILAAAGAILAFFPGKVMSPVYDSVKDSIPSNPGYNIPESADEMGDVPFVGTLGTALLIFGLFLFIVSFLAFVGACCTSCCRCLLIIYSIIVIIMIIIQIIVGTLLFVSDSVLHDNAKSELKDKCKNDYKEDGKDAFSMAMNLIHQHFECCGIDSGADFNGKQHRSCDKETPGCYSKLQELIEDNIVWCGLGLAVLCLLQVIEVFLAITLYKDNKIGPI